MRPDIFTAAGRYFDLVNPQCSDIGIEEIAHALSHLCRFNGHTCEFYSVAQHSVLVSHIVPSADAFAGLMHDAAEAFIGDVSAPLKQFLPDFKAIEKQVEAAVFSRFGLPERLPDSVKRADLIALATELRDLMPATTDPWEWQSVPGVSPLLMRLEPMAPWHARQAFLDRFKELQRPLRQALRGAA